MGSSCCASEANKGGTTAVRATASYVLPPDEELVQERHRPNRKVEKEWTVVLKKEHGRLLGLVVDLGDEVTLVVERVDGGLMGKWNQRHPDAAVREEDRIVSINGSAGDAKALTEVCSRDMVLDMVVQRLAPA